MAKDQRFEELKAQLEESKKDRSTKDKKISDLQREAKHVEK